MTKQSAGSSKTSHRGGDPLTAAAVPLTLLALEEIYRANTPLSPSSPARRPILSARRPPRAPVDGSQRRVTSARPRRSLRGGAGDEVQTPGVAKTPSVPKTPAPLPKTPEGLLSASPVKGSSPKVSTTTPKTSPPKGSTPKSSPAKGSTPKGASPKL